MSVGAIRSDRESAQDVRSANVAAVCAISNILRSSLGPQGLDKMLVDDIGDVCVTNDGATILRQLEVQHPAAKLLVDLSELQDVEVGDGTTSVVLLAAELLKRGNELVKNDIHATSVIAGYKLAMKECVKYIKSNLTYPADAIARDVLLNTCKTSLSSKFIGVDSDHFANLILDALLSVKIVKEKVEYPVSAVNVLTSHGKASTDSYLVQGYALNRITRAAQGMPMCIRGNVKIALIEFSLRQHRMQLGVQVNVEDPKELEKIRQMEKDVVKRRIELLISAGCNVVVTSEGIDDMALKYFVEAKVMAFRRVEKKHLRRLAKLTGATICLTLSGLDGTERFDASCLGSCAEVVEETIGDWDAVFFRTAAPAGADGDVTTAKAATIVLRGANELMLDELERSVHDALCAVSRALTASAVCAGGGAVETALCIYLEDFAKTLGSREQLAIAEFAESLLIIPKVLAVNAAQDSIELLARLRAHHARSQSGGPPELKWYGLDLVEGTVRDSLEAGVLEPSVAKINAIRFATEAAVTILRIDDLIKIAPEPKQEGQ
eukprot:GHVS01055528.1.p1 GENE.GHVS01055528.1~~GHVS01055528.1.p1  ORF type:complete len:550 (-),score=81.91 GHVS01055528.1:102-1751(-)